MEQFRGHSLNFPKRVYERTNRHHEYLRRYAGFFLSEQVNTEIFNTFEILDNNDDNETVNEQAYNVLANERKLAEDEFKNRWGWVDLAIGLVETTGEKFTDIMQMAAIEVLTLATYSIDKIEIIKLRHGSTNSGAS
jgi:hypothetical protein